MIKTLIGTTLILVTTSSLAMDIDIGERVKTINARPFSQEKLKIGSETEVTLHLDKYVYVQGNVTKYQDFAKLGSGGLVGATFSARGFSPYAEISVNAVPNGADTHPKTTTYVNYDLGTSYNLTKSIKPFVEVDSVFLKNRSCIKPGVVFELTNKLSADVSYSINSVTSNDSVEAGLTYAF